jgi:large subunit ribosomal protein L25
MIMEPLALTTEPRTQKGKNAARQLRAKGLAPAVFYGAGIEPVSLAVAPKALIKVLSTPFRRNQIVELEVAGQRQLAMVKELQVHPVTRAIEHVDLYKVDIDKPVNTEVPLLTEGRAKGVVAGGEIYVNFRALPVRCTPDKVPALITVDVTNMELGDTLRTKDIAVPAGVEIQLDPERSVISCAEPRKIKTEEEEAAEAAAKAGLPPPAAAAAAAAPAAGAAAPAAEKK